MMAVPPSTSLPVATADTVKPDYDENGVDLSLVRYSLSLTPTQRLKAVENFMNAMASVRRASPLPAGSTKSSDELEVTGQRVTVLSLRRLVELKRALARPKDLAMLPVLEATLREREG